MTVPSSVAKSGPYICNGVTDVFNYDFRIVDKSHLNVILTDANGAETSLALTTHYTVSDVGSDTGSINLTAAGVELAITGTTLTILRNPPFTQETDLQNQGAYLAQTVEDRFDLLTMQIQTVKERSDRSIAVPASDEDTTLDDLTADLVKVAARDADIGTVADISADVSTVAGVSDDVTIVAGIADQLPDLAGVVLETATDASSFGFVLDEDDMASDSDKKVPTQQSVKAYALSKSSNLSDLTDAEAALTNLNVKALNADGGFTFSTGATTQDFMPANGIGGTFKAAHVFASSDAAAFAGMRSGQALVRTVTGAGGLNPIGDYALFIVAQNPDYTDTTLGELGTLRLATLANGRGDKDLIVGTVYKHVGDGTSDEGASMAFELGVRQFQNNSLVDLTYHHQIIGAFMPNPTSTWGGQGPIGFYSEHYKGAGYAHFLGIDDESATGTPSMQYGIALFRQRDSATPYFLVSGLTGQIESIWTDGGVSGGTWRRTKNSASPAASDILWNDYWRGKDSGGNNTDYARLYGSIVDATDGSEDGSLQFRTLVAGTETDQLKIQNGLAVGGASPLGTGTLNTASAIAVAGTTRIDGSGGIRPPSYTASQIASAADAVNTTDKIAGKTIWDTTNNRLLSASGSSATAAWIVGNSTTAITPA